MTSAAECAFLRWREDLRRVGERFSGSGMITLAVPDPLQTSLRLTLFKVSYFSVCEDTLVPKRLLTDYQPIKEQV